jgi:hypothetical protein
MSHEKCPNWPDETIDSEEVSMLPTRVLHFDFEGRARIVETKGEKNQYVNLSHCWGQSQHLYKLDQHNKASLMAGFDLKDLPKTFSEAAMITMRLGFEYHGSTPFV